MQLKLLRVLQEKRFEPVGSTETREVDVRVILATNQDLEALVAAGDFRQDLYYRVNVVMIELPPLRERTSDIPALAHHFIELHSKESGKAITAISDDAMQALTRYTFPGNVRELGNIIERAIVVNKMRGSADVDQRHFIGRVRGMCLLTIAIKHLLNIAMIRGDNCFTIGFL